MRLEDRARVLQLRPVRDGWTVASSCLELRLHCLELHLQQHFELVQAAQLVVAMRFTVCRFWLDQSKFWLGGPAHLALLHAVVVGKRAGFAIPASRGLFFLRTVWIVVVSLLITTVFCCCQVLNQLFVFTLPNPVSPHVSHTSNVRTQLATSTECTVSVVRGVYRLLLGFGRNASSLSQNTKWHKHILGVAAAGSLQRRTSHKSSSGADSQKYKPHTSTNPHRRLHSVAHSHKLRIEHSSLIAQVCMSGTAIAMCSLPPLLRRLPQVRSPCAASYRAYLLPVSTPMLLCAP